MTRDELVAAVQRAGANHLDVTDLNRFADEAVRELDSEELWPWRIAEQTGAAPLTIATLGPIDSVRDAERRVLRPARHSELIEQRRDLTASGAARFYYTDGNTVRTWPVSNVNITVRHFTAGGWTTGSDSAASGSDTPRADTRWHDAIFALMRVRAASDDRDWETATKMWERYQARLEQARQAELRDNWDEPDVIRVSETY